MERGEPLFSLSSSQLTHSLSQSSTKLRSSHYFNLLCVCVQKGGLGSLVEVNRLFRVIESATMEVAPDGEESVAGRVNCLEALAQRSFKPLEFSWNIVGASLWQANSSDVAEKQRALALLAHLSRILQMTKTHSATCARLLAIMQAAPQHLVKDMSMSVTHKKSKKKKKETSEQDVDDDPTILARGEGYVVRFGDVFIAKQGKVHGLVVPHMPEKKTRKNMAEEEDDDVEASSSDHTQDKDDCFSSSSDSENERAEFRNDDMLVGAATPRSSNMDSMMTVLDINKTDRELADGVRKIQTKHLVKMKDMPNGNEHALRSVRIKLLLYLALTSCSREACAFSGLMLKEEHGNFPESATLDSIVLRAGEYKRFHNFVETACGVFAAVGNVKLSEQVLARHVERSKGWVKNPVLGKMLDLPTSAPLVGNKYVAYKHLGKLQPSLSTAKGWRVRYSRQNGSPIEGCVTKVKDGQLTVEVHGTKTKDLIKQASMESLLEWWVAEKPLLDLVGNDVKTVDAFGANVVLRGSPPTKLPDADSYTTTPESTKENVSIVKKLRLADSESDPTIVPVVRTSSATWKQNVSDAKKLKLTPKANAPSAQEETKSVATCSRPRSPTSNTQSETTSASSLTTPKKNNPSKSTSLSSSKQASVTNANTPSKVNRTLLDLHKSKVKKSSPLTKLQLKSTVTPSQSILRFTNSKGCVPSSESEENVICLLDDDDVECRNPTKKANRKVEVVIDLTGDT